MKTTTFGTIMMISLNISLRVINRSATSLSKDMGVTQSSLQRTLNGDAELTMSRMYSICHHADISAEYITQLACKDAELLKDNGWTIVEKADEDNLLELWKNKEDWCWDVPIRDTLKLAAFGRSHFVEKA